MQPLLIHILARKLYGSNKKRMTPLFKKLNYKIGQQILVLNAPESFAAEMAAMASQSAVFVDAAGLDDIEFAMVFVTELGQIEATIAQLAPKLGDDATLWYCYPKGSSKKYKCNFNRDTGWTALAPHDLEPVRMVAIDEDWSALRFRHTRHIKTITRRASFALTPAAKARTTQPDT